MEYRKFLRTIYDIQKKFDIDFAGVARTFSFGLRPLKEERQKLERWFESVNSYKRKLYELIYKDFKKNPHKYLLENFDYDTFFKGRILPQRNEIITSEPVLEGLRMEINGNMRSFRKNYERIFRENVDSIRRQKKLEKNEGIKKISDKPKNRNKEKRPPILLELIKFNNEKLQKEKYEFDYNHEYLIKKLKEFADKKYEEIIKNFNSYDSLKNLVEEINILIKEYNFRANLLNQAHKELKLFKLFCLKNPPRFPIIEKETAQENIKEKENLLSDLQNFGKKPINFKLVLEWIKKTAKKSEKRKNKIKILSFERRLSYWINKNLESKKFTEEEAVKQFINALEKKIKILENHFLKKEYEGASRNKYFNLLTLRARLANPKKEIEINTLRSRLVGAYLKGKIEKEVITLPGFSWSKKPLKNVAFAFKDNELYICISSSAEPFNISEDGLINFVKTTGGSKQKAKSRPKDIKYIKGDFNVDARGLPLFLKLHFGKSHARRYIFNKNWGVFSDRPGVFLNNARLKRIKKNPGDPWQYFLDLTLSGPKIYGFREFSRKILKKIDAIIGIDRGEVIPIAYAVLNKNNEVLESGLLGKKEYIDKLKEYEKKIKEQQSKGERLSKSLRGKVSRLQKTTLETAISQILNLVAKYKAAVAIENLSKGLGGVKKSIPKKTYKKVEDLLANALNFAGLLRIDTNKNYWGALIRVIPSGTSQICLNCKTQWNSALYDEIYKYSQKQNFQNVDFINKKLEYKNIIYSLNEDWLIYSREKPFSEKKTLDDLKDAISSKNRDAIEGLFKKAINCRPKRDLFICHRCDFQENADIVGAVNIARRGLERFPGGS